MTDSLDAVREHLRTEYAGVFPEAVITRHIERHVLLESARTEVSLLLERLPETEGLLDVGAGYGSYVLAARELGVEAFGIELADFEVSFARRRLKRQMPELNAEDIYRLGSATGLPFADACFDVVTLWNVVEHIPDIPAALREAKRVLRPGGRLMLLAPNYAAIRREAHYLVPWPPLLPKRLARPYLRALGRDPSFFLKQVHPCTNRGVRRVASDLGFVFVDPLDAKFDDIATINQAKIRWALAALDRIGALSLARVVVHAGRANPISKVIAVEAIKP